MVLAAQQGENHVDIHGGDSVWRLKVHRLPTKPAQADPGHCDIRSRSFDSSIEGDEGQWRTPVDTIVTPLRTSLFSSHAAFRPSREGIFNRRKLFDSEGRCSSGCVQTARYGQSEDAAVNLHPPRALMDRKSVPHLNGSARVNKYKYIISSSSHAVQAMQFN